jgi:predicted RNase H-like nuclease (RuvC/YqgF family)
MPAIGGMMETFALCVVFAGVSVWLIAKAFPRRHSSELPSRTEVQEAQYQQRITQADLMQAQDEIVRLDAANHELEAINSRMNVELSDLRAEFADLIQSASHWKERHDTV